MLLYVYTHLSTYAYVYVCMLYTHKHTHTLEQVNINQYKNLKLADFLAYLIFSKGVFHLWRTIGEKWGSCRNIAKNTLWHKSQ